MPAIYRVYLILLASSLIACHDNSVPHSSGGGEQVQNGGGTEQFHQPQMAVPMLVYQGCQYPNIQEMVCGSDGKNYLNVRHLICVSAAHPEQNLTLQFSYPCVCHEAVVNIKEELMCGTDNITYPSKLAMACIHDAFSEKTPLATAHEGACENGVVEYCWSKYLPHLQNPVCGSDNLTYKDYWFMKCVSDLQNRPIELSSEGTCPCEFNTVYDPVCGSDMKTYPNIEQLNCVRQDFMMRGLTVLRKGCCEFEETMPCINWVRSVDAGEGLCGNDGITYDWATQMRCYKKLRPGLDVNHEGQCLLSDIPRNLSHPWACEIQKFFPIYDPICTAENKTYQSIFYLACHFPNSTDLSLVKEGHCAGEHNVPNIPDPCEVEDNSTMEVCGCDLVTYKNMAAFVCAATKIKGLEILHYEACREESDPCEAAEINRWEPATPVCANGTSYVSTMAFWCEVRTNPDLKLDYCDECI